MDSLKKVIHKNQPLKYGTTRAHEMRVSANRVVPSQNDRKVEKLTKKIISNIDEINTSFATTFNNSNTKDQTLMSRNIDKVLFETIDSTVRESVIQPKVDKNKTILNYTNRSELNFSLLNKVKLFKLIIKQIYFI